MKNKLIVGVLFLVTGLIIGNNIYNKIDFALLSTFNENDEYYLIQQGIYNDKESMQKETRDINPKVYEFKDDKYYVYVGITGNKDNYDKIKNIYDSKGIKVNLRKIKINDDEFKNNINQLDILIENTNVTEEIFTIEEVILSSFNKKVLE